jgi:hypothetical protein
MDPRLPFLIAFGVVAFFLALLILIHSHDYRREKGLAALAKQLGFTYEKEATQLLAQFERFRLFRVGGNQRITNVLQGKIGSAMVWLFDYNCIATGFSKHSICVVRSPHVKLPHYYLRCQAPGLYALGSFIKKTGIEPGQSAEAEIDFPQDEQFSKKFVLKGKEEDLRPLFDAELRHHLLRFAGTLVEIEGNRDTLLFTTGIPVLPKDARGVIQQATELFTLFSQRTASGEGYEEYAYSVKSPRENASRTKAGYGIPTEDVLQGTGPEKKGGASSIVVKSTLFFIGAILGVLGSVIILTEIQNTLAGGTQLLNNTFMIGLAFFVVGLGIVLKIALSPARKRHRAKLIKRELEDMSASEGSGDHNKAKKE